MAQEHAEHRKYIRLNSCFPVEFSLYFTPDKPISVEYQGFTSNVSEGGLCISVKNLKPEDIELISVEKPGLKLTINIPLSTRPVKATAAIAWSIKDEKDPSQKTYLIGASYHDISPGDKKRILNYARRIKWLPRAASLLLAVLFIGFLALSFNHIRIKNQNESLIKELVSVSEIRTGLARELNGLKVRRDMLEAKLSTGMKEVEGLRVKIAVIEKKTAAEKERLSEEISKARTEHSAFKKRIEELSQETVAQKSRAHENAETMLAKLTDKIEALQMEIKEVEERARLKTQHFKEQLQKLQDEDSALKDKILLAEEGKVSLEQQLGELRAKSGKVEKASVDTMVKWLRVHQIRRTGLVLSYEGDRDLKDWGFTYDQALASQAFLISGNKERAEAILNFYAEKAKRYKGLFYNAYDVKTGSPVEYIVHSGPNIWIAISACQYAKKTGDKRFLMLAEAVAKKMIQFQNLSSDGSIKGGPNTEWVSTEHNLDAYALFKMLYGLTRDEKYKEAASVALAWLKDIGYNRPEGRFMRGRGDSTIATDTFSWAIAALGPALLKANAMDPDGIMEFAENECRVETKFYRPENRSVDIVGFDFAKAANLARGGVVSTEWSAQMVVAFEIMADYHKENADIEKERIYRSKAEYYLSQLGKMVISSPSPTGQGEGCLPYASMDNIDTGHGWRVAKGRRTGSVAATAYYIFASKDYNPLSF